VPASGLGSAGAADEGAVDALDAADGEAVAEAVLGLGVAAPEQAATNRAMLAARLATRGGLFRTCATAMATSSTILWQA